MHQTIHKPLPLSLHPNRSLAPPRSRSRSVERPSENGTADNKDCAGSPSARSLQNARQINLRPPFLLEELAAILPGRRRWMRQFRMDDSERPWPDGRRRRPLSLLRKLVLISAKLLTTPLPLLQPPAKDVVNKHTHTCAHAQTHAN